MVEIEDKVVSEDLFEEFFNCDYAKCKGICCVEGDSGAPLEIEEIEALEESLEQIKEYMSPEGIEAVERSGTFEVDSDGDYTTTLIGGAECAFSINDNGFTLCAIEKAYRDNKISFNKPISCHLYPIRVVKLADGMVGLNYHRWSICSDAVKCGTKSKTKVYQALKEPLVRVFGETFYRYLTEVDEIIENGEVVEE